MTDDWEKELAGDCYSALEDLDFHNGETECIEVIAKLIRERCIPREMVQAHWQRWADRYDTKHDPHSEGGMDALGEALTNQSRGPGNMTKEIWKFPIETITCEIVMPRGAKILHVALQHGTRCLWAEVGPEQPKVTRSFQLYGTGQEIPAHAEYVCTWLDGDFLRHLYERF